MARAYRVRLTSSARPEALLARLRPEDGPAALWGRWFGGGVLAFRHPAEVVHPERAEQAWPRLASPAPVDAAPGGSVPVVGGGWLACLGYSPGSTTLVRYDSLLRWSPGAGWTFESLGVAGAEADRRAQAGWSELLREAEQAGDVAVPAGSPVFATRASAAAARERYLAAVEAAVGDIHRGAYYQLNLCLRLHARWPAAAPPGPALFAAAAARLDPLWAALVAGPDGRFVVSLSPESFLQVRGTEVSTSPIKGTAPRPEDGVADASRLRASAKDAAENVMIVDLMRNDLARVCRPGTVRVDGLLDVEPHPGVWHLVSTVRGTLRPDAGPAELLAATFPPGSVTGAPKQAACAGIDRLEDEPRGAYTGAIGLVSPVAGMAFNVAIRTLELDGSSVALGVGGGITAESVAVREWYECLHKAAPIVAAAGGRLAPELRAEPAPPDPRLLARGVFESVLLRHGEPLRLAAHLSRLDLSCRELYGAGIPADLAGTIRDAAAAHAGATRAALRIEAAPGPEGLRVRLAVRPLGARPDGVALRRAERPTRGWRHKWQDRDALDAAEAACRPELPWFADRDDGIAETSRGNLFLCGPDGVWSTPVLEEDVLPGVTRREVLDVFAELGHPVALRRCDPAELAGVSAVFWTSSLSGAVPVPAVDGRSLDVPLDLIADLNRRLRVG